MVDDGPAEQLANEAKETRFFGRAAVLSWASLWLMVTLSRFLLRGGSGKEISLVVAAVALITAAFASWRFVYHGTLVLDRWLALEYRGHAQVLVAIVVAALPVYYFGGRTQHAHNDLLAYVVAHEAYWVTTLVYGVLAYWVAQSQVMRPAIPVRAYLIVVAVTAFLALVGGKLEGAEDAWGQKTSRALPLDREEMSDGDLAFVNYLRFIAAGYAGVTAGLARREFFLARPGPPR
jgi:uncharacterized membrane protein